MKKCSLACEIKMKGKILVNVCGWRGESLLIIYMQMYDDYKSGLLWFDRCSVNNMLVKYYKLLGYFV